MLKENTNHEPTIKTPNSIHKIFKQWKLDFLKAGVNKGSSIRFQELLKILTKAVKTRELCFSGAMNIFEFVVITMQASINIQELSGKDNRFEGQKKLTEEAKYVGDFLSENANGLVR